MTDTKYISLKVCGRPHENSGFNPLVYFNSPLFDVPDTVYSGFNEVSYFFSIIIEKTQVVYTLIMNNVRSCRGFRLGNLKIAMSIPKGYRISNGKSPYDALISIKDYIITSCMTCKDPIRLVYEFNSGIISPTLLDDIAHEFPLEPATGPYHPMSVGGPKGYITLPEEQISLLLSDVQYNEFSAYGEVVVAQSVQATNYTPIVNLQVPRKRRFAIIVDGLEDGYVENPDEEITVRGKKDPKFYDNKQFTFTISDLRRGKIIPNVVVDEEKEIVSISTVALSSAKTTRVQVVFPKEVEGYFYTFKKDFQLEYASGFEKRVITLNDYVFTLKGEEIGWLDNPSNFRVTFNKADEYSIKSCKLSKNQIGENQLIISVDKVVKAKPNVPPTRNTDSDVIKVDVLCKEPPYNKIVTLCFNTRKGYDTLLSTRVSGSRCVFHIPRLWNINTNDLLVRYETSDCYYTSSINHDKKSNTYSASNFDVEQKTFADRIIKPNRTLFASFISILVGFILGCVLMFYAKPIIDKLLKPDPVFSCEYCRTTFKSNDLLTTHVHSEHLKHLCPTCGERFQTKEDLTSHINDQHLTEVCDICNKRFSNSEELSAHRNSEHFTHECDVCHKRFETSRELKAHKKTHSGPAPDVAKPFKCGSCIASFDERAQLEWHIKDKHESKFHCRLCDKWFNSMTELDNHMGSKHKHYECPHCGHDTYFASREELNKHVMDKHRSDER